MTEIEDLRLELQAIARELHALRFTAALRRLAREVKYDPNQPRLPKGAHGGGRWAGGAPADPARAKMPTRTPVAGLVAQLGRTVLANPEAAGAAGAAALPMAAGAVGVSRAAGLYDHYTTGNAITPILGLDGGKLETGPPPLTMGRGDAKRSLNKYEQECEEQLDEDFASCGKAAQPFGGSSTARGRQVFAICASSAMERYAQCLRGGVSSIRTRLHRGG